MNDSPNNENKDQVKTKKRSKKIFWGIALVHNCFCPWISRFPSYYGLVLYTEVVAQNSSGRWLEKWRHGKVP